MDMLEAAKFYRDCIQDVQKSIMMEVESKSNSLVDFSAKMFKDPARLNVFDIHINFTLNGTLCNLVSTVPAKASTSQLVSLVKKDVAAKIADKITPVILSKLR